ncbi:MAG: Trp repressor binding protein [Candidatus Carbobacillus altaicus]|uniref:Trp repressor binding protein n=1 Tax=Candidatus Carbonibacillus altaicus TaxID=2163959 RepID=A0A2R6Y3H2_9BACL|nr:MAG: Trp repressor binding protein [Candidatus Carbobacillus altaicus]
MKALNVTVIYYSSTGTNYTLANWAEEAAKELACETRVRKVPELAPREAIQQNPAWQAHYEATQTIPVATLDDLTWADVLIFSMPTRYGMIASQMKQFLDTTGGLFAKGLLVDKVVTAMTSAQNDHGGQETTLISFYTQMFHWGALVVTPGYTSSAVNAAGGNPYGTSVTARKDAADKTDDKTYRAAVFHQVQRAIQIARKLKA